MDYNEEEMLDFSDSNIVHGRHIHNLSTVSNGHEYLSIIFHEAFPFILETTGEFQSEGRGGGLNRAK